MRDKSDGRGGGWMTNITSNTRMALAHGFQGERPYLSTCKGNRFYLDKPAFDIEEVAHALGNICRFGGHCRRFYSVAEHSMLVATIMEQLGLGDPFEGLMHDAHEAYLVDLPKPWKSALLDYVALEQVFEKALRVQYSLTDHVTPGCKTADLIALAIEARQLIPSKGDEFMWPDGIIAQANKLRDWHLACFAPEMARDHFLACYAELRNGRGLGRNV